MLSCRVVAKDPFKQQEKCSILGRCDDSELSQILDGVMDQSKEYRFMSVVQLLWNLVVFEIEVSCVSAFGTCAPVMRLSAVLFLPRVLN